ncbi:polycomb protein Suz12-like isoform X2 [Artemia franciscana]|uniref:polycomb protein Suz12-like isoform X2 n=1 Tax=Artemia franciscana TaxID=6661 RepID=UPI0032D9FD4C
MSVPLFLHRNLSYIRTKTDKPKKPRSVFRLENFQKLKQERATKNVREKEVDLELFVLGLENMALEYEEMQLKIEIFGRNSSEEVLLDSFSYRCNGQNYPVLLSSKRLKKEGFSDLEQMHLSFIICQEKDSTGSESKRPRLLTYKALFKPFALAFSADAEYHFPLHDSSAESRAGNMIWEANPYIRLRFKWKRKHGSIDKNGLTEDNKENINKEQKAKKVLYYYNAGGHSVQTQAMAGFVCPWCNIDGRSIAVLLMHLKHNHFRFKFSHVEKPEYHCVEVTVNEHFDGSFAGNPQRTALHPSSNRRRRPLRCLSKSEVIVWNNKKQRQNGELEDDSEHQRPSIFGHQRLYYHTGTCMPIGSEGIDVDSEGENDPEWLQTKTQIMIDEFTDVNSGEKEMWKMWNLFKMKHNFVGDKQMPYALNQFVNSSGGTIVQRQLVRNFLVHVSGFFDFGVISQYRALRAICDLRSLLVKDPKLKTDFSSSVQKQIDFAKEQLKQK